MRTSAEMQRAKGFADRLARVYGEDLVSVVLYGSAARGEFKEGVSDLNLLVILERLDAESLRAGSGLAREWAAAGNPPPLMMSRTEWTSSADVFTIEYADIRDAHVVLEGADLFDDIALEWEDLRLQVERELKEKKIQLREQYLLMASAGEGVGSLLMRSFPTFLALFRASLRLLGEEVPRDAGEVVERATRKMGIEPAPWRTVQKARAEAERLDAAADDPLVTGYIDGVTRASEWIDGLERGGDHPGV